MKRFYLAFVKTAVTDFPAYKRQHKSLKSVIKTIYRLRNVSSTPHIYRLKG